MTDSIKQAKKLTNKFFHPQTGEFLRDITPHFTKKAESLLNKSGNEISDYDFENMTNYHTGLLIIANPGKDI